ncbi:MAG: TIGR03000 domain-containing protein [Gemmataceae bacterium]
MSRRSLAVLTSLLALSSVHADGWLFPRGPGPHMQYGPYTGGHGYSYNEAYSYGYPFSAADTWRRNIYSQPQGYTPYRPYERPIQHRVWPKPDVPYIAVPGADGLPTLVKPGVADGAMDGVIPHGPAAPPAGLNPIGPPLLQPVPPAAGAQPGMVHIQVPAAAEVWVEKEKLGQAGDSRMFQTPPLAGGSAQVFSVRAKWNQGGREVEQFRVVTVRGGETATLRFESSNP